MENNYDATYHIYVFNERIVRIATSRAQYYVVSLANVKSYMTNKLPEGLKVEDLLYTYNYSLASKSKGFYLPEESELSDSVKEKLYLTTKKIIALEKYTNAINILKRKTSSNIIEDTDIYGRIFMRELELYEKTGEVGSLLEAEFKCSKFDTIDSLVEYTKLKYSDTSEMLAYIRYKNFEVRKLINENNIKEVENITEDILQKLAL
jgi:hypothetical protein